MSLAGRAELPSLALTMTTANHLTPLAEMVRAGTSGYGSIAVAPIPAGTSVATFGGVACDLAGLRLLGDERRSRSIQIDDDRFLAGPPRREPGDAVNHSCDPNCRPRGAAQIVAMRDIAPGEMLTFDYGTTDGSDYDEFDCACGAARCRSSVGGTDWRRLDVRARHGRAFSPYLLRRMASHEGGRALGKADVEALLSGVDHDPVGALRAALVVIFARPHATFDELLSAASLPGGLPDGLLHGLRLRRDDALDELTAHLNEDRGRDLRDALAPVAA